MAESFRQNSTASSQLAIWTETRLVANRILISSNQSFPRRVNKRQVRVSSPAQCLSNQFSAFAAFAFVYPIIVWRVTTFAVLIDDATVEFVAVQFAVLMTDDVDIHGTIVSEVILCFINAFSNDLGPLGIIFVVAHEDRRSIQPRQELGVPVVILLAERNQWEAH